MAQTPPPFQAPEAPQAPATSNANKACLIAVVCVLGMCIVMIFMFVTFFKGLFNEVSQAASCAGTFSVADNAVLAYAKEHNGHLPNAATWQDDIAPYYQRLYDKVKSEKLPKQMMPVAPGEPLQCVWGPRKTGLAFNTDVSGLEIAKIKDPDTTVLLFEADQTGTNLALKFKEMPKSKAPKVMNNERDWIVFYVSGNRNPYKSGSSTVSTVDLTPEDGLTPGKGGAKTDDAQPTTEDGK